MELTARSGKLEYLEAWKASEVEQDDFFHRVASGETPKAICEAKRLPYSRFMDVVKGAPVLKAKYAAALETWVESLAHETVSLADGVAGAEEAAQVSAAKLQIDTRFRLAAKLYREMFGEELRPTVAVTVNLGDVAREVRELEARLGIGGKVVEALPVVEEPPI